LQGREGRGSASWCSSERATAGRHRSSGPSSAQGCVGGRRHHASGFRLQSRARLTRGSVPAGQTTSFDTPSRAGARTCPSPTHPNGSSSSKPEGDLRLPRAKAPMTMGGGSTPQCHADADSDEHLPGVAAVLVAASPKIMTIIGTMPSSHPDPRQPQSAIARNMGRKTARGPHQPSSRLVSVNCRCASSATPGSWPLMGTRRRHTGQGVAAPRT
jgi:hypothetical protein